MWRALFAEEQPPVVLVGHSMGGAVAVRTAATKVSGTYHKHSWSEGGCKHCYDCLVVMHDTDDIMLVASGVFQLLTCLKAQA